MQRFLAGGGRAPKRTRPNVHMSSSDSESDSDMILPNRIGNQSENSGLVLSDTDVLDCPICTHPLSPPVFQCETGHLVCNSCSTKITKCPSCNRPFALNRCIAIEKILESAKVSCRNRQYGCTIKTTYALKHEHASSCIYTPCSCPHVGCNYVARSSFLYRHFSGRHSNSLHEDFRINVTATIRLHKDVTKVYLQESRGTTLFVLNRLVEPLGSLLSVVCVAPVLLGGNYTFKLTTRAQHKKISLTSSVVVTPNCITQPPKQNCLLVTSDFSNHLECLELLLLIRSSD